MHFSFLVLFALSSAAFAVANHHHIGFKNSVAPPRIAVVRRDSACAAKREKRMAGHPGQLNGSGPSVPSPASPNAEATQQWQGASSDASTSLGDTGSSASSATSTPQAARASSSVAFAASTAVSTSASSSSFSGEATFFYQNGVAGACGNVHSDSDKVVALMSTLYGNTGSASQYCGKSVAITNTATGASVTATVADACPSCSSEYSLDLSVGAFTAIGSEDTGVLDITWNWA